MKQENIEKNIIGKSTINSVLKLMEKPFYKNIPKQMETHPLITIENPIHKTNKTIEELKEIVEQQIFNTEKQEKNNKFLAKLTIFIAIVGLLIQCITIILPNKEDLSLSKKVLELSKENSQNQVKILMLQNELLKSKKTSENEKNLP
jgi:hypothetical protein